MAIYKVDGWYKVLIKGEFEVEADGPDEAARIAEEAIEDNDQVLVKVEKRSVNIRLKKDGRALQ